ncbi:MAG: DNA gyrase subunit A [Candidatus Berkelbacteria bacterium]|nr:DNA gyrase subunit A [Candidatus Berkelbacteria bacterium]
MKDQKNQNPKQDSTKETKGKSSSIIPRPIVEEMEKSYLDYAMSVIIARALPDVRDGLKPVHRRIIYAMGEMGLSSGSRYTKSAKIVGEVLGKYHPHGDMAVYDTLVGMAQPFRINHPLVDGQGNFGSIDGDGAAAPRYTEAKLERYGEKMLEDIEKNTVDFSSNYDNTLKEPTVLPTKIPNLLVNGTVGIAVGMATNIPPHNLSEICDGIIQLIEKPELTVEELMQYIKGPDFPTAGTIFGVEGIKNASATGHGKIIIRGEAEVIEDKKNFKIHISSIPFQVNKADLITKIAQLVKEKKLEGIADIRDESDRTKSVSIIVELKSTAYPKKVLNRLYDLTPLQISYHINMLALVERIQPRILNIRRILIEFINHRREVVKRRTQFDLERAKERAHILEGLKKALDHIDEIIKTIKGSENREVALANLVKKYEFTKIQANAILDMRLSALAALERKKVENELKEKLKLIEELTAILASEEKILKIIRDETNEIKEKFGRPRQTKIIAEEIGQFKVEDLIPNEPVVVTLTEGNYIKRVAVDAYRKQGRGGKGVVGTTLKEKDKVLQMQSAKTHDDIYFFTNLGKVFSSKIHEIPPSSRQARGQAIVNLIQIQPDEYVTAMLIIPKNANIADKYFTMGTKGGVVKRTRIGAYSNIRKTGLIAVRLREKDELRFIDITCGNDYVMMVTRDGQGIIFSEEEIRPMGRSAAGVIGIRLKSSDEVISMGTFSQDQPQASQFEVVTVLENGLGKRTQILKHFPTQKRGGYGVRTSKTSQKTGKVVEAFITNNPKQDLILVSISGQAIRIPLKSAKLLGRDTQGVRLMKLGLSDKLASVSAVEEQAEIKEIKVAFPDQAKFGKADKGEIKLKDLDVKYYDQNAANTRKEKN